MLQKAAGMEISFCIILGAYAISMNAMKIQNLLQYLDIHYMTALSQGNLLSFLITHVFFPHTSRF